MPDISRLVQHAIDEVNQQLDSEQRLANDPDTILLGSGADIDSLTLINFIVTLEQLAEESYGVELSLSSDVALLSDNQHFKTVGSITAYLSGLMTKE